MAKEIQDSANVQVPRIPWAGKQVDIQQIEDQLHALVDHRNRIHFRESAGEGLHFLLHPGEAGFGFQECQLEAEDQVVEQLGFGIVVIEGGGQASDIIGQLLLGLQV